MATKGLNWRQVHTLSFLSVLELGRLTTPQSRKHLVWRANSFSPRKHSYSVYRPIKCRECQAASRQRECSLQNGKARLVPAGPRFHGHTQHTPLWFLTSPKRHRLPCVSFPESASRSRVSRFKRTASTKERRSCSPGPVASQKPAVPQEEQDLNCSQNASRLPRGGTVISGRRS